MAQTGLNLDKIFNTYAGADQALQVNELGRFVQQFDTNKDVQVSIQEFNVGWRQAGYPNPQKAAFYFLLLDRVPDEILNILDYNHIFRIFDENGDTGVSLREFRQAWNALFD